jgi:hypothetical protein
MRNSEMRAKQRIARMLTREIIANTDEHTREMVLAIHWVGGRHFEVRMPRPKTVLERDPRGWPPGLSHVGVRQH